MSVRFLLTGAFVSSSWLPARGSIGREVGGGRTGARAIGALHAWLTVVRDQLFLACYKFHVGIVSPAHVSYWCHSACLVGLACCTLWLHLGCFWARFLSYNIEMGLDLNKVRMRSASFECGDWCFCYDDDIQDPLFN